MAMILSEYRGAHLFGPSRLPVRCGWNAPFTMIRHLDSAARAFVEHVTAQFVTGVTPTLALPSFLDSQPPSACTYVVV